MSAVPTNMIGLLTQLQTLQLSTGLGSKANVAEIDLQWISNSFLTSLHVQDLSVAFGRSRGMWFSMQHC